MNAATQQTNIATMSHQQSQSSVVSLGFGNENSFALMQRAAKLLSSSTLVPTAYRSWDEKKGDNPNAIANCVVALNMSQRMGADPLMIMQNLYIVEGKPSWSAQFIIAAINGCGRFSPLRFDIKDIGQRDVEYEVTKWVNRERVTSKHKDTIQNIECVAWAIEKETGARIDSPKVSIEMAVKEGWYSKSGSKWQTMPEVMLRYRTASFFGKIYAPELLMGLQSAEELHDIIDINEDGDVSGITSELAPSRKPEVVMPKARYVKSDDVIDDETGEIHRSSMSTISEQENKSIPDHVESSAANLATDGEKKFILNRARNNGVDILNLIEQAGISVSSLDLNTLDGLTKDGFIALRDQLPKIK